jgi:hypothetical protein
MLQLLSTATHSRQSISHRSIFFASHNFTLFTAYLYEKDERSLPVKLHGGKIFLVPRNISNNKSNASHSLSLSLSLSLYRYSYVLKIEDLGL